VAFAITTLAYVNASWDSRENDARKCWLSFIFSENSRLEDFVLVFLKVFGSSLDQVLVVKVFGAQPAYRLLDRERRSVQLCWFFNHFFVAQFSAHSPC
jgi:UDP-N-acetylmuramate-alanine ligase